MHLLARAGRLSGSDAAPCKVSPHVNHRSGRPSREVALGRSLLGPAVILSGTITSPDVDALRASGYPIGSVKAYIRKEEGIQLDPQRLLFRWQQVANSGFRSAMGKRSSTNRFAQNEAGEPDCHAASVDHRDSSPCACIYSRRSGSRRRCHPWPRHRVRQWSPSVRQRGRQASGH